MRIAFCINKYFPYGGLQRDFMRIAKEVLSRGHTVRVYTRQWEGDNPTEMEVVKVPTTSFRNIGKNVQYFRWVQKHLQSNPVDKVVGFNRMPGLDVYFAGDVCYAENNKNRGFFYKLSSRYRHFCAFEKAVFSKGLKTKILLLTNKNKLDYQKHYDTEDDRFYLLPPGIDFDRKYDRQPEGSREAFREEFGIAPHQKLLLQVCSNYELKGVDRSLNAIATLPEKQRKDIVFFVVGQDSPDKMRQLAQSLGIENSVHFFGGRDDIARFMLGSDLMLHPARHEAAGIVILESIVSGLPIIVSGACGYAPYVQEADAGLVLSEPFEQNEYNRAIQTVLSNTVQLNKWNKNAKEFADHANLYGLASKAADIILEQ